MNGHEKSGVNKHSLLSRVRDGIAVDAAKAVASGSRLAGNQGTSLPGKTAMKLSPPVLADLAGQVRNTIFAVCGTNGKTTTNNILCAMLEFGGHKVVCNRLGANMLAGIAGAFVREAGIDGRLNADHACLEVDEASAHLVFRHVRPDYLILTNLFRDQLDRYGEIDITIELLKQAIQMVPDMTLIVNADDPFSVYLAEQSGNPAVYYGIPEPIGSAPLQDTHDKDKEIRESGFCKVCGAPLAYDFYHFSQMGSYHCTACSFRRPAARYEASDIRLAGGVSFTVQGCRIESPLAGEYSVYNLLAVWAALRESGQILPGGETAAPASDGSRRDTEAAAGTDASRRAAEAAASRFNVVLRQFHTQFGRNEHFIVKGREVILNLAKNPAGFNQNIEAMLEDPDPKRLVIVINDNDQDGTDVSWLWDVEFERVRDASIRSIVVSGIRRLDMGLRLKYEEIEAEIADTPEEAVENQLAAGEEKLYVLVNYTALFSLHRYLLKKQR